MVPDADRDASCEGIMLRASTTVDQFQHEASR
jgi:hypothetical protein